MLKTLCLLSYWFVTKAPCLAGFRFQMGRLRLAAGVLHPGGDTAPAQRGRQGALRAGLRGRKRWQRLGRSEGEKGKLLELGGGKG